MTGPFLRPDDILPLCGSEGQEAYRPLPVVALVVVVCLTETSYQVIPMQHRINHAESLKPHASVPCSACPWNRTLSQPFYQSLQLPFLAVLDRTPAQELLPS